RGVVGPAGLTSRRRGCADDCYSTEVVKRLQPLLKNGNHHVVSTGTDPAEFASASIVVVVSRELAVLGSQLHVVAACKMLLHVSDGTEQTLFFTAPKGDANCSGHGQL